MNTILEKKEVSLVLNNSFYTKLQKIGQYFLICSMEADLEQVGFCHGGNWPKEKQQYRSEYLKSSTDNKMSSTEKETAF